jgi:hypothetical protein
VSESERNGVEPERSGASTYVDRKAVAAQKGIHEKTVADWEAGGAFAEVISNGPAGKKRYRADAFGNVEMNPDW